MYPSSVVHTGVKSRGCENSTAQESPIQSWKRIFPSVVCASKSGATSPIANVMSPPFLGAVGNRRAQLETTPKASPEVPDPLVQVQPAHTPSRSSWCEEGLK